MSTEILVFQALYPCFRSILFSFFLLIPFSTKSKRVMFKIYVTTDLLMTIENVSKCQYKGDDITLPPGWVIHDSGYGLSSLRPSDAYMRQQIIGSDNDLSPGWYQSNIWANAGIMLIRPLGTNVNEILNTIYTSSFTKMHWKMSSVKWPPYCLGLNMLMDFPFSIQQ